MGKILTKDELFKEIRKYIRAKERIYRLKITMLKRNVASLKSMVRYRNHAIKNLNPEYFKRHIYRKV